MAQTGTAGGESSSRGAGGEARRQSVMETLSREGFLSVRALADSLGVSDMTVRRDLRRLSALGEVRIVHGGAALTHGTLRTPDFVARADVHATQKMTLAVRAAALVEPGDTIAIDAGTTAFAFASALPPEMPLRVVTNSVPVLQLLLGRPDCHVVVVGGEVSAASQAMVGPLSVQAAEGLRVRTYFVGAAAIDARGVYVETDVERPTKLAMMGMSDRVVLLADAGKFHRFAPVLLCGLDRIDTVVTDHEPGPEILDLMRERDVRIA